MQQTFQGVVDGLREELRPVRTPVDLGPQKDGM